MTPEQWNEARKTALAHMDKMEKLREAEAVAPEPKPEVGPSPELGQLMEAIEQLEHRIDRLEERMGNDSEAWRY